MSDDNPVPEPRSEAERILGRAYELALEHLETQSGRGVAEEIGLEELRQSLSSPLPDRGEDGRKVLERLVALAEPGLVASTGPRFFGFVIGGATPTAVGADWLVSAWDQNSGLYAAAPAVAVIEEVVAGWLLDLLDLPRGSSVGFVTGGQMANWTALAAARNEVLSRVGWDVESDGLIGAPPVSVVVSEEAHATILTSLRYLGLGDNRAHRVECDEQGRMRVAALERALDPLDGAVIVCAQAGDVNSGAFDPLERIVEVAHRRGAWVHVDGAFGLWAAANPRLAPLLAGHRQADSWSTDAHKWLNVPYDCGVAIVADPAAHRRAMSIDASYLEKTRGEAREPLDWVPEASRRARVVPVYAALRSLGRQGVLALVEACCASARRFAERLGADPRVEVLNEVVLNQVLVRLRLPGRDLAQSTDAVVRRIQRDRICWLGGTLWRGEPAIRVSVSNWSTGPSDVDRSVRAILDAIDREQAC